MADITPGSGQIMNWTLLDDTGAVPTLETSELTEATHSISSSLSFTLHIDMCHADSNAAGDSAGFNVLINSSVGVHSDEDWHLLGGMSYEATGGSAILTALAATSGAGETNPERVELATTANYNTPGAAYFILDNTIANSEIVYNQDTVTDDYIEAMDDMSQVHDASDCIFNIVDHWDIQLPQGIQKAKVQFWNKDADATYACRVRWNQGKDIE